MGWGGLLTQHGWCACNKTARRRQDGHCGEVEAETVGLQLQPANAHTDPHTSHGCGEARRMPLQVSEGTRPALQTLGLCENSRNAFLLF